MILSETTTKYNHCMHHHKELATSHRHTLQHDRVKLLCLVCEKLQALTFDQLCYVNTYIIGPHYSKKDESTEVAFYSWLFNS